MISGLLGLFIQMTVTWTSGYNINEAIPFVEWGPEGKIPVQSPAVTLTFGRNSMCGTVYLISLAWHHIGFFLLYTYSDPVNIFPENLNGIEFLLGILKLIEPWLRVINSINYFATE